MTDTPKPKQELSGEDNPDFKRYVSFVKSLFDHTQKFCEGVEVEDGDKIDWVRLFRSIQMGACEVSAAYAVDLHMPKENFLAVAAKMYDVKLEAAPKFS